MKAKAALVAVLVLGVFYMYRVGALDHAIGRDAAPINGTVTALNTYPTSPAHEVCFAYDDGTSGCWYVVYGGNWERLAVGQHLVSEPIGGAFCSPHPAPSAVAPSGSCPDLGI